MLSRLYCDYLMPSQIEAYRSIIITAVKAGYAQISVRLYYDMMRQQQILPEKLIIHRHDIDTDLRTTRKIFEIEKEHGIKSSFYFRLSTLDIELMQEIEEYGSEASYHYEELATYAKKNKIKDAASVRDCLPAIRKNFIDNFSFIEKRTGRKMRTVAGHGDFANRLLKVNNTEILADFFLRQHCGIEVETYDRILMDNIDIYITDRPPPKFYSPCPPLDAIGRYSRIYLLTHPKQVETNWAENMKDSLFRVYETLTW